MQRNYEIVEHPQMEHLSLFVVSIEYRTAHFHRDFEMNLVLSGEVSVSLPGRVLTARQGELLLLNPNEPHELKCVDEEAVLLCMQLSPKYLRQKFPGVGYLSFDRELLNGEDTLRIRSLLTELAAQYVMAKPWWQLRCGSLTDMLMYETLRLVPYHFISEEAKRGSQRRMDRLSGILDYVDENYTHRILLSDICEREGLSLTYLSHFFRENLNQSFQEYVTGLRLNRAKEILTSEDRHLLDVCMESGFSDPRYLNRAFLEREGCTPKEYRSRARRTKKKQILRDSHSSQYFPDTETTLQLLEPLRPDKQTLEDVFYSMIKGE